MAAWQLTLMVRYQQTWNIMGKASTLKQKTLTFHAWPGFPTLLLTFPTAQQSKDKQLLFSRQRLAMTALCSQRAWHAKIVSPTKMWLAEPRRAETSIQASNMGTVLWTAMPCMLHSTVFQPRQQLSLLQNAFKHDAPAARKHDTGSQIAWRLVESL